MPRTFAQKPTPGGWVRYGIAEDHRGVLRWRAEGGDHTADVFAEQLPGVPVLSASAGGGDPVPWRTAEAISGVAWPVCGDWIRERM